MAGAGREIVCRTRAVCYEGKGKVPRGVEVEEGEWREGKGRRHHQCHVQQDCDVQSVGRVIGYDRYVIGNSNYVMGHTHYTIGYCYYVIGHIHYTIGYCHYVMDHIHYTIGYCQ